MTTPPFDFSPEGLAAQAAALGLDVPGTEPADESQYGDEESPFDSPADYADTTGLFGDGTESAADLSDDGTYDVSTETGEPDPAGLDLADDSDKVVGQAPLPPLYPVWELLEGDLMEKQLSQLWQWVRWLVDAHDLRATILPCWAQHPPAVQVLTALHQGWIEIYLQPWGRSAVGAKKGAARIGHSALVWLDHLDTRMRALKPAFTPCVGGHPEPPKSEEPVDEYAVTPWDKPLDDHYNAKMVKALNPPVVG